MSKYASITLSFDHFHPTAQLVPDLILTLCQTKIAERESFYHSDFLSSRKFNIFANFSFSSRNWAKEFQISLSPLETGERNSGFSFSSRNWARKFEISLSPLETRQRNLDFSFSSRNWLKGIQISLSPLECGEIVFKFLFLFSIGLFCISSMTERTWSKGIRDDVQTMYRQYIGL